MLFVLLTTSIRNTHIPSTSYPIFAQLSHLCTKLFRVKHNDVQRGKGLTITSHEKKYAFLTRKQDKMNVEGLVRMLGRHLQKFAQLSTVCQELSSSNTADNWHRSERSVVFGGEKTHNKLSSQPIAVNLAYKIRTRLLYPTIPSPHLTSHSVHRCGSAQSATTTTQDSKEVTTTKEEG
jgi:hypothetical protein